MKINARKYIALVSLSIGLNFLPNNLSAAEPPPITMDAPHHQFHNRSQISRVAEASQWGIKDLKHLLRLSKNPRLKEHLSSEVVESLRLQKELLERLVTICQSPSPKNAELEAIAVKISDERDQVSLSLLEAPVEIMVWFDQYSDDFSNAFHTIAHLD